MALSLERAGGMGGVPPITTAAITAWAAAHWIEFTPWEIDTIRAVDLAAVAAMTSKTTTQPAHT